MNPRDHLCDVANINASQADLSCVRIALRCVARTCSNEKRRPKYVLIAASGRERHVLTKAKWTLRALSVVAALLLMVIAVLAWPVSAWRTGETPLPVLVYLPQAAAPATAGRVWVDADAACGTGRHRDPDDCLALLSLSLAKNITLVGISTVFGNAPVAETDAVMRALVQEIRPQGVRPLPVFTGCAASAPGCQSLGGSLAAQDALVTALQLGALDIVALGPLTNIAAVIARDPVLARSITRVVAVMGRRPGHRFHPSENHGAGAMLFGHGPIFRDLNAVLDPQAVADILRSGIPLVLLPYTAAREVLVTSADLDTIAGTGAAGRWVAERSRDWLEFWRSKVGLDGFYPFDLMAAAYLRDPSHFHCARVSAWVGDDARLPWFSGGAALLVSQDGLPPSVEGAGAALYCDVVRVRVVSLFE